MDILNVFFEPYNVNMSIVPCCYGLKSDQQQLLKHWQSLLFCCFHQIYNIYIKNKHFEKDVSYLKLSINTVALTVWSLLSWFLRIVISKKLLEAHLQPHNYSGHAMCCDRTQRAELNTGEHSFYFDIPWTCSLKNLVAWSHAVNVSSQGDGAVFMASRLQGFIWQCLRAHYAQQ